MANAGRFCRQDGTAIALPKHARPTVARPTPAKHGHPHEKPRHAKRRPPQNTPGTKGQDRTSQVQKGETRPSAKGQNLSKTHGRVMEPRCVNTTYNTCRTLWSSMKIENIIEPSDNQRTFVGENAARVITAAVKCQWQKNEGRGRFQTL